MLVKVATVGDIRPGHSRVINARGHQIALFNVDGKFYATTNTCPHRGGPIGEGELVDKVVTCPWHGWQFDVTTGENVSVPMQLQTYMVVVQGDDVMLELK